MDDYQLALVLARVYEHGAGLGFSSYSDNSVLSGAEPMGVKPSGLTEYVLQQIFQRAVAQGDPWLQHIALFWLRVRQ